MSGLVTWLNLARLMIKLDFKYETNALMESQFFLMINQKPSDWMDTHFLND